ncbi:uncharacterized protein LOC117640572 isoform X1 [Thrips palmi]|uniref:Uncharacterized protein LOC117640572 isoform X1 n=1 Tax=Thrips palmi TaxID=161013 RepID=A0A6P8Y8R4_THRPL|nr:uncharacterized protein LOC117640572 isoform X1 [Thrips palmi]
MFWCGSCDKTTSEACRVEGHICLRSDEAFNAVAEEVNRAQAMLDTMVDKALWRWQADVQVEHCLIEEDADWEPADESAVLFLAGDLTSEERGLFQHFLESLEFWPEYEYTVSSGLRNTDPNFAAIGDLLTKFPRRPAGTYLRQPGLLLLTDNDPSVRLYFDGVRPGEGDDSVILGCVAVNMHLVSTTRRFSSCNCLSSEEQGRLLRFSDVLEV